MEIEFEECLRDTPLFRQQLMVARSDVLAFEHAANAAIKGAQLGLKESKY